MSHWVVNTDTVIVDANVLFSPSMHLCYCLSIILVAEKNLEFTTARCQETHTCIAESLSALVMNRMVASFTQITEYLCTTLNPILHECNDWWPLSYDQCSYGSYASCFDSYLILFQQTVQLFGLCQLSFTVQFCTIMHCTRPVTSLHVPQEIIYELLPC